MDDLDALKSDTKATVEALLFSSSDPLSAIELAKILEIGPGEVIEILSDLSSEYADKNRGIQLRELAGGWRMFTHPAYHDYIEAYISSWDTRKLSQAALEALSVIAYMQPVSRDGVKAVRGVNSDGVISSLVEKGLIKEVGKDANSTAALFGTTQAFLEKFGLKSIKELPPLEEFAPNEEAKEFIRERLSSHDLAFPKDSDADEHDEEVDVEVDLGLEEVDLDANLEEVEE
ncbi:MAG: SMC-Scp complex subunit ScpB [Coriobacteriia bacterium]|nr:SMC-Scp complex subunit ScpB [Coriobacteriia bacterium]